MIRVERHKTRFKVETVGVEPGVVVAVVPWGSSLASPLPRWMWGGRSDFGTRYVRAQQLPQPHARQRARHLATQWRWTTRPLDLSHHGLASVKSSREEKARSIARDILGALQTSEL